MKERKIGEVFEFGGEWYQCVKSPDGSCKHCDMNFGGKCPIPTKECMAILRSDLSYVIFKKLEKVGKPYVGNNGIYQSYKLSMPIHGYIPDQIIGFTTTEVVIKQNE